MLDALQPELTRWPFSDPEMDLGRVFNPGLRGASACRLQGKLEQWTVHGKPLTVALTGGSASAESCHVEGETETYLTYLDLFRAFMAESFPHAAPLLETVNVAQGATTSLWSTIMMDSLLPAAGVDILVWEYAINDHFGEPVAPEHTPEEMEAMLELWLRAALRLPSRPAIVLLYLWDSDWTTPDTFPRASAWEAGRRLVQRYVDAGHDITTVVVPRSMGANTTAILKDHHHPNCDGSAFIGRLLQTHMLSALSQALAAGDQGPVCHGHPGAGPPPVFSSLMAESPDRATVALLHAESIQAVHNWLPRYGRQPAVDHSHADVEMMTGAKAVAGREDRKLDFRLPICDGPDEPLDFAVRELDFSAVALGFSGIHPHGYSGSVRVSINNGPALEVVEKSPVDAAVAASSRVVAAMDNKKYFPVWYWPPEGNVRNISACVVVSNECGTPIPGRLSDAYRRCVAESSGGARDLSIAGYAMLNWIVLLKEGEPSQPVE
eukprot:jgi/Tetstr1/428354/TSEL_018389.t1